MICACLPSVAGQQSCEHRRRAHLSTRMVFQVVVTKLRNRKVMHSALTWFRVVRPNIVGLKVIVREQGRYLILQPLSVL